MYDILYARKDYRGEARRLHALIQRYKRSPGNTLLDVACGTGGHIAFLREHYAVQGLDLDPRLLAIARRKHPDLIFHRGDMTRFDLGRRFDAITCLFSAIGYASTMPRLHRAVRAMVHHLRPGGVLIIEPWLTPHRFEAGRMDGQFVDHPDLKVVRFNVTRLGRGHSVLNFHYMVARRGRIEHFTERHRLGLFTFKQYEAALRGAGLQVILDRKGLMGRGLFIGVAPLPRRSRG